MRSTGAEVIKIAAQANRLADCVPLIDESARHEPGSIVLIGMGPFGLPSRVLGARFGNAWTYAGALASVGQVTVGDLTRLYRFGSISAATDLYGLTGNPIGHSVSPAMHNAAFDAAALDAVYLPLPAIDAADFLAFAGRFQVRGASITIPHKVSLMSAAGELREEAGRIGAINTLRRTESGWIGGNTDAAGFLRPLAARGIALRGRRAAILGAGGAARAVAVALSGEGARVTVHARARDRAEAVARLAGAAAGGWPPVAGSWDILVNTTPVGMYPHADETPIPQDALSGGVVYDLIYNPPTTRLLRDAAVAGCETIGGLDMLVGQAEEQFAWWTGMRPAAGVMRSAALARLAEFSPS